MSKRSLDEEESYITAECIDSTVTHGTGQISDDIDNNCDVKKQKINEDFTSGGQNEEVRNGDEVLAYEEEARNGDDMLTFGGAHELQPYEPCLDNLLKDLGQQSKMLHLTWSEVFSDNEKYEEFLPTRLQKLIDEARAIENSLLRQKDEAMQRLVEVSKALQTQ